jgi:hypothetical protein
MLWGSRGQHWAEALGDSKSRVGRSAIGPTSSHNTRLVRERSLIESNNSVQPSWEKVFISNTACLWSTSFQHSRPEGGDFATP